MDTIHAKVAPAGTSFTWTSSDTTETYVKISEGLDNADIVITGVSTTVSGGTDTPITLTCTAGSVTKTVSVSVSASA